MTNVVSFDGPLMPQALRLRTRTKYLPAGTASTVSSVAVLPVGGVKVREFLLRSLLR